jgi:hypothetical protein
MKFYIVKMNQLTRFCMLTINKLTKFLCSKNQLLTQILHPTINKRNTNYTLTFNQ